MDNNLEELKKEIPEKIKKSIEFFTKDLATLRTGRASQSMLDNIKVDYYGNLVPLEQVGTITIPESRMIIISVWEKNVIFEVETKIRESNIGINPIVDGTKIKLPVPPLTEESRKELVKKSTEYAEKAKISVRQVRKYFLDAFKELNKNKLISDDTFNMETANVEKVIKSAITDIDTILEKKNKELMSI